MAQTMRLLRVAVILLDVIPTGLDTFIFFLCRHEYSITIPDHAAKGAEYTSAKIGRQMAQDVAHDKSQALVYNCTPRKAFQKTASLRGCFGIPTTSSNSYEPAKSWR
jgi:hypothetical protein